LTWLRRRDDRLSDATVGSADGMIGFAAAIMAPDDWFR